MVLLRNSNITIGKAADVAKVFQDLLNLEDQIDQDKEHFYVMHLASHRRINLVELVAIGTLTGATIHPRETYRRAVMEGADSIIIAHNHPSGDPTPSEVDMLLTKQLREAGEILQILLLDHISVPQTRFSSFLENKTAHYAFLTKPKHTQAENYDMKKHSMESRQTRWKEVNEHMGSVNKVILVGNLTRDPEMKQTEGKKPVCLIGLATNRHWTDDNGHRHEEPEYHRIVAWDKLAETCHQFLRKGRKVYLEGRLQSRTYTGQDGMEKHAVEIVLEKLEMLDSMPHDVRQRMEVQDALEDTSNGHPAPQV